MEKNELKKCTKQELCSDNSDIVFTIPGALCSLNKYIQAERSTRQYAARIKRDEMERVEQAIQEQVPTRATKNKVWVNFIWREKNKKKDKDNIAFAKKFILDAMVNSGMIQGDGWDDVVGFSDTFKVGEPGVEVNVFVLDKD